jgi:hypothetical protein
MYDLATAKTRLGITGTTQDAIITAALNAAVAMAERYCDRLLAYSVDSVTFNHFVGDTLFLPRYPIEAIISTTGLPDYLTHFSLGMLELEASTAIETATIQYSAGYRVYPGDLEMALWGIFDCIYPAMSGSTTSAIDSVTIPDVGTIRYASNKGLAGVDANVLGAYNTLLETYRRVTC